MSFTVNVEEMECDAASPGTTESMLHESEGVASDNIEDDSESSGQEPSQNSFQANIPGITAQLAELLDRPIPGENAPLDYVVEYCRAVDGQVRVCNQVKKKLKYRLGLALYYQLAKMGTETGAWDERGWKGFIEKHFQFLNYQSAMHARRFAVEVRKHLEDLESDATYTELLVAYNIRGHYKKPKQSAHPKDSGDHTDPNGEKDQSQKPAADDDDALRGDDDADTDPKPVADPGKRHVHNQQAIDADVERLAKTTDKLNAAFAIEPHIYDDRSTNHKALLGNAVRVKAIIGNLWTLHSRMSELANAGYEAKEQAS